MPLMNIASPEFLKTFWTYILLIWKILSYSKYQTILCIVWQIPSFSLIQTRLYFHCMSYESKCYFPLQLFLNICDFIDLSDTHFLSFHDLSYYMCFLATYGNCSAPLSIILCQYLFHFGLNWGRGVVQEQNPPHLSGILCDVVFFSCFLVIQNTLWTFSALCWTLNWYSYKTVHSG